MGRIFNVILLIVAFSLIGCERNEPSNGENGNNNSSAPGYFSITRCELDGSYVVIEWSTSERADYYNLWYQSNSGSPWVLGSQLTNTSFTDKAPLTGSNIYWVEAVNSSGSYTTSKSTVNYNGSSGGGGGGGGGGGSSTQTEGTVTATVYCSGPGASLSSYAQWANGRTTTITWIYRESQNQYYIYGGTYCSNPDANQGRGILYPCSRGYNSIRVDSDYVYDSYGHAQFYDVYLRFTIP